MAARQRDPRLLAGKAPALHHFAGDFRRRGVDWPAEDGNRHNRFPAHSENIADGVGGGDAAKVERVIDNRHKEIGGADDRGAITEIVNGGIIAGFVADKQVWIDKLRLLAMQDSFQHFREILQPQPAPWLYCVKRMACSLMDISCHCNPAMLAPKRRGGKYDSLKSRMVAH